MSKCTCTMQALPNGGMRLIQCPSCGEADRDPFNCELDALRARVAELEEHRQGAERLIDRLIETCPEARPIIHEFARETLNR